jgi:hypothetical protein
VLNRSHSYAIHFTLSKLKIQNNRYWGTENPHAVYEVPLHDVKLGVWCAISARRITGLVIFHEAINSERYVRLILSPFYIQQTNEEKSYAHFVQDNATAHIANNSMVALDNVFGERIISPGLWPPQSPDLNSCDFYLWGTLKEKVYVNNPHIL